MGHFIYRFHHQITYSLKKKVSDNFLEQTSETGLLRARERKQENNGLNSAHTQQKMFAMGSAQTLSQFPIRPSFAVNKHRARSQHGVQVTLSGRTHALAVWGGRPALWGSCFLRGFLFGSPVREASQTGRGVGRTVAL